VAKVEVIHSGVLSEEAEEKLARFAKDFEADFVHRFSTAKNLDFDLERIDGHWDEREEQASFNSFCGDGLKRELAKAAAAEATAAAPRRKKSRAFEDL
jgi:hypothetical protein